MFQSSGCSYKAIHNDVVFQVESILQWEAPLGGDHVLREHHALTPAHSARQV